LILNIITNFDYYFMKTTLNQVFLADFL
jgi:hypothetical protein